MTEIKPPAGMDINEYLERWQALEPHRCTHDEDDFWLFHFDASRNAEPSTRRCDVISFQGVGTVEDLIAECVANRIGWSHELLFDRDAETFSSLVVTGDGRIFEGEVSLNPGISLLSAYLQAINEL